MLKPCQGNAAAIAKRSLEFPSRPFLATSGTAPGNKSAAAKVIAFAMVRRPESELSFNKYLIAGELESPD